MEYMMHSPHFKWFSQIQPWMIHLCLNASHLFFFLVRSHFHLPLQKQLLLSKANWYVGVRGTSACIDQGPTLQRDVPWQWEWGRTVEPGWIQAEGDPVLELLHNKTVSCQGLFLHCLFQGSEPLSPPLPSSALSHLQSQAVTWPFAVPPYRHIKVPTVLKQYHCQESLCLLLVRICAWYHWGSSALEGIRCSELIKPTHFIKYLLIF